MKVISKGDYNYTVDKKHPRSTKNGYVLYHRKVIEKHIGRYLNTDEIVHHIDGNKKNNDITNLQVMTKEEHTRLHVNHGRKIVVCKCAYCGITFKREIQRLHKANKNQFCSRTCNGKFNGFKSK